MPLSFLFADRRYSLTGENPVVFEQVCGAHTEL